MDKTDIRRQLYKLCKEDKKFFDQCINDYFQNGISAFDNTASKKGPKQRVSKGVLALHLASIKRQRQKEKKSLENIFFDMAKKGITYGPGDGRDYAWRNADTIRKYYKIAMQQYRKDPHFKDEVDTNIRLLEFISKN